MYMLLVNVSAILIECIVIYSSLFASFTLTFFVLAFKNIKPFRSMFVGFLAFITYNWLFQAFLVKSFNSDDSGPTL